MSSISDFKRLNKIGQGAFGIAWLVESKIDFKKYVIKEIGLYKMQEKERFEAKKEVSLLSKMNHPNIVAYYNSFEESGCFHILMEYCEGGDLYRRIKAQNGILFKEDQILDYFIQICLALKHIHDQRILHRDIKPQNIFLTKNNLVKLGDFGIAKAMDSTTALTKTTVGTPFYFSPEICEGCPYNNKSDIWSLGCILYELCSLNYAFYGQDITILAMRIKKVNYKPVPSVFSAPLRSLIDNMFRRRPDERPNINAILRKPFILKKIDKFLPPENPLSIEAKKPAQKRPSTANVVSRVDSGLSNKKKTRVGKDIIVNSPYMPIPNRNIHDKRVSPRFIKQEANPLAIRQQELYNKYKIDMINMDRENGWKNVLSSEDSKSDSKESKLNVKPNVYGGTPPAAIKQKFNSPAYDHYYAELDRIKEQQNLREKEGKALMKQMFKHNDNKPAIKIQSGVDGIYRKIDVSKQLEDRNKINDLSNLHGKLGANAGDQAIIQEFLERKRQAKNIKHRDGSAMALVMGGQHIVGEQLPIPRQTPRNIEDEIADRLNKIRQKNYEQRQAQIFEDHIKKHDFEINGNVENFNQLEARKAVEELKKKLKQRTEDLRQKLERKEKEKIKEIKLQIEDDEPNNAILFPKRNTPIAVNIPDKPVNVSPPLTEPSSISVILEKLNENISPAGDTPKVEASESGDIQPSLSVVLSQLDEKSSRPSTASSSEQSEIRKRKDDILKRLNMKPNKVPEEENATKKETSRKSWIFDMDENNICKRNNLENTNNTISDCGTLVDISFLHHDDEKVRGKWKFDEELVSDTLVLKNIKTEQDSDSVKFEEMNFLEFANDEKIIDKRYENNSKSEENVDEELQINNDMKYISSDLNKLVENYIEYKDLAEQNKVTEQNSFYGSTMILDQPSINMDLPTISENLETTCIDKTANLSTIIEVSQEITEIELCNEYKEKSNLIEREEVWKENVVKEDGNIKECDRTLEIKNEKLDSEKHEKEKETPNCFSGEKIFICNNDDDSNENIDNLNKSESSESDTEDLIECFKNALSIDFSNSSSSKSINNQNDKTIISEMFDDQIKISSTNSLNDLTQKSNVKIRRVKSDGEINMNWDKEWSSEATDDFSSEDFGDEEISNPENIFLKIEKIRIELEEKIGIDLFIDAIEFVRENQDLNGDQLAEKLKEMIGDEASINEILQLVVLEEQYHNIE